MVKQSLALMAMATVLSACAGVTPPPPGNKGVGIDLINAMGEGVIGNDLGARLGDADRIKALESEYRALEYGAPGQGVSWAGKKAGQSGVATAGQPYQVGTQDCRQLVHVVTLAAKPETRRGAACRNTDGSWTPLG